MQTNSTPGTRFRQFRRQLGWKQTEFAERLQTPLYFIDDSPRHHSSVARDAERAVRIHFVAERRLSGFLGPAADSHYRTDTWTSARQVIERDLAAKGY